MNDNLFSVLDKSVLPPSIGPVSELVHLAGLRKEDQMGGKLVRRHGCARRGGNFSPDIYLLNNWY